MRRNEVTKTNIQRSTVDFRVSIRHKHTHTYKQAQAQTRALVFVCDMYSCLCFVYVANAWSRRVQTVDHVHFAQTVQFNVLSLFLSFRFLFNTTLHKHSMHIEDCLLHLLEGFPLQWTTTGSWRELALHRQNEENRIWILWFYFEWSVAFLCFVGLNIPGNSLGFVCVCLSLCFFRMLYLFIFIFSCNIFAVSWRSFENYVYSAERILGRNWN